MVNLKNIVHKDYFKFILIYCISILYYLIYFNVGISYSDPGWFVESSIRILNGQIPYKDYFYFYPPGASYLLAFIFKIFGINLLWERLLWVIIISGNVLMAFNLSRKLMPLPFCLIPPFLALMVPGPWHKSFLPFLYLLAATVALGYINHKTRKWAFILGITAGSIIYFRYDVAGFIAISYVVFMAACSLISLESLKIRLGAWLNELLFFLMGFFITSIPGIIFIVIQNSRNGIIRYLVYLVLNYKNVGALPFPILNISLFVHNVVLFFDGACFYLPAVIIFFVVIILIWHIKAYRLKNTKDRLLLILTFLGIFAYNQTIIRADWGHLLQSIHIPYILACYLIWYAFYEFKKINTPFARILISSGIIGFFAVATSLYLYIVISKGDLYTGTIGIMKDKEVRLDITGARVYVRAAEAKNIEALVGYIKTETKPGEPILVVPFAPMIYFLADRKNPTYFDTIFPGFFMSQSMQESFMKDIVRSNVRLIIYQDFMINSKEESKFANYSRLLYNYMTQHYVFVRNFGVFQAYIKKGQPI